MRFDAALTYVVDLTLFNKLQNKKECNCTGLYTGYICDKTRPFPGKFLSEIRQKILFFYFTFGICPQK